VPHRPVTRSPSRPELEAMSRPPLEQVAWPTLQGQQYTSCWPLKVSHHTSTLVGDATVLDDYYALTTTAIQDDTKLENGEKCQWSGHMFFYLWTVC